jgi:hypothetical protein
VVEAGEHIPGMAALWDVATPEERREMVILLLEPGGLYYDMEQKIIAALKPRPAFLPILRMLNGIVEYDEARGLLLVERWQDRNRRASDYPQAYQRDRQTLSARSSLFRFALLLFLMICSRTVATNSKHSYYLLSAINTTAVLEADSSTWVRSRLPLIWIRPGSLQ